MLMMFVLESDVIVLFLTMMTSNVALMSGSSKHGNTFRAFVGSICDVTRRLDISKLKKNTMEKYKETEPRF